MEIARRPHLANYLLLPEKQLIISSNKTHTSLLNKNFKKEIISPLCLLPKLSSSKNLKEKRFILRKAFDNRNLASLKKHNFTLKNLEIIGKADIQESNRNSPISRKVNLTSKCHSRTKIIAITTVSSIETPLCIQEEKTIIIPPEMHIREKRTIVPLYQNSKNFSEIEDYEDSFTIKSRYF